MAYDRTNTGTLGRNKRKESEKHPSHTGTINVDGQEFWLSAWVKEKDGEKFFSLAIKPKEPRQEERKPKANERAFDDLEDSVPF